MAEEDRFTAVAREDELRPGGTAEVVVDGHRVLLVRDTDGSFYAVQACCSHQGRPLAGGRVWEGVLTCPWHYFQWNLRSGENVYPKNVYPLDSQPQLRQQVRTLRTYPVRVRERVVEIGSAEAPGSEADGGAPC